MRRFKSSLFIKEGFTLMELVVVIGVMAILALLMVPNATEYIQKADDARHITNVRGVYAASETSVQTSGKIYIKDMVANKTELEPSISKYANLEVEEVELVKDALADKHTKLNTFFISPNSSKQKIIVRYNTDRKTYSFNGHDERVVRNDGVVAEPVIPKDPVVPKEPEIPKDPVIPKEPEVPENVSSGLSPLEIFDIFKGYHPDSKVKEFSYRKDDGEFEFVLQGFDNGIRNEMEITQEEGKIILNISSRKDPGPYNETTREMVARVEGLISQSMGMSQPGSTIFDWAIQSNNNRVELEVEIKQPGKPRLVAKFNLETGELIKVKNNN